MQDAIAECNKARQLLWNGGKVRLHYAKAGDLKDYLNLTAIRGEVVVRFWLRPGDAAVEEKRQLRVWYTLYSAVFLRCRI